MKTNLLLIGGLLGCFVSTGQTNLLLKKRIDSLYTVDQAVQEDIIAAFQNNAGKKTFDSLDAIKVKTFQRHIPLLHGLLDEFGLPTYSSVEKESADHFLTLVNHSYEDIPLQEKVARLAKPEIKRKNISGPALALMIDKMRIKSGRQQLYGSQCDYDTAGNAIALNLYKPKKVDKRRKEMGLGPLKDYLNMMTELHQQMNKRN